MAFSEFELKRIERMASTFIEENRPPAHARAKLDIGFRITGQSLEIFEIRPCLRNSNEAIEMSQAKVTYIKKPNRGNYIGCVKI